MKDTAKPERRYLTDLVLLTCVVERGEADDVVAAARKAGAPAATIFYARGTGVRERLGLLGIAIQPEKEVIQIVMHQADVDPVFEAMAEAGKLHLPGKGFLYMTACQKAYTYTPEDWEKTHE